MSGLVDRGCSSLQMDAMCLSMLMMKQEFLDGMIRDDDEETQIMEGFDGESFDDDWKATEAAAIARDSHIQQSMADLGASSKDEVYAQARRVIEVALVASVTSEPEIEEGIAVPPISIHVEEEFAIPEADTMPCPCEIDEVLNQIEAFDAEFDADAEAAFPVQMPGPLPRRPKMTVEEVTSDAETLNGPVVACAEASPADVSARRREVRPERRGRRSGMLVPTRSPPVRPVCSRPAVSPIRSRACSPTR